MEEKTNSSISIRLATELDIELVSQIVASAYEDSQKKFKPESNKIPTWMEWWISLSKPLFNEHKNFIERELTYVILLNEIIIGTFRLEQHGDKSELDDLCILPQYQNKGYGMCVLKLIEEIHSINCIELATPYFCTAN